MVLIGISANGLIALIGAYSLWNSRQIYTQHAAIQAENIAIGADQTVSKSIEKIDLALDFVVQELERELAQGPLKPATVNPFLERTTRRIPEVESLRVSDVDGTVILGLDTAHQTLRINDSSYFQHFKQGTSSALFVSEPLLDHISQHVVIVLAKRFNDRDGRVSGVVCASVPLAYFTQLLSQFDIGAHGTIALRDDKLHLITQLPLPPERDDIERTVAIRAVHGAPAYAIVGLASDVYLADWWIEVYETSAFIALFCAMTGVALLAIAQVLNAADLREASIAELAFKDPLTGLPTIRLTEDRLTMAMHQATRDNNRMGVMFLDLDGFKLVNDAFGHAAGDCVLRAVAHRIRDAIRANDTVSRVGGDEFMIVLGALTDRPAAAEIAAKIVAVLSTPIPFNGRSLSVQCSIGISLFPDDAQDMHTLRHLADEAMYTVKRAGKNNWAFYQSTHWQPPSA